MDFRNFLTQYILQFFEMRNLYIMWPYVLRFILCKIIVDAFSWLYSKLLMAKLSVFVFGAESLGNSLAFVAALFVTSVCRLLSLSG